MPTVILSPYLTGMPTHSMMINTQRPRFYSMMIGITLAL
jgi:hypothetical protein